MSGTIYCGRPRRSANTSPLREWGYTRADFRKAGL